MSNDDTTIEPLPGLQGEPMQFDAHRDVKAEFFGGVGVAGKPPIVDRPGRAEVVGSGGRVAVEGEHNWVPIGPRNVGGRVRCIAISPTGGGKVMFAGPASGGIYKSIDAGETWFPLWHDQPSLSMGAIAIAPSRATTVWAATGESSTGAGETIPSSGVWRSTDSGDTWENPTGTTVFKSAKVAALAVHPTKPDVCWAAADNGVFRTLNGGTSWEQFGKGATYSDVCILSSDAKLWVFLAMSGSIGGQPALVRIENPEVASATLRTILPDAANPIAANLFVLPALPAGPGPAGGPPSTAAPADGKLAPFAALGPSGPFIYAVWARNDRTLYGLFQLSALHAVTAGAPSPTVTPLANHPNFSGLGQGEYNLAIAVNPADAADVAFGMQEIFLNRAATTTPSLPGHWAQVQNQFLYIVDRAHHADHHQIVFAARPTAPFDQGVGPGPVWLWDANDGGISVSGDWAVAPIVAVMPEYARGEQTLPIPPGVPTWRKRSHGISAAQMYDLTQHPRLPSVMASGYQDNGGFVSTGGMSWDLVITADGGYVAFDPDDPYRLLATFQSGVAEVRFPARLRNAAPLLRDAVQTGSWPRILTDGFLGADRPSFVAETVFHPTRPGRVFNARKNRLYATRATTGDRWRPEPLGCGVEIIHEPTTAGATAGSIQVLDTAGGMALGLLAQRNESLRAEDRRLGARVRTLLTEPFDIRNGQQLQFILHDDVGAVVPAPIPIPLTVGPTLPARASAAQLAAYITANSPIPTLTALPVVWPRSTMISLFTRGTGHARRLGLQGTALGTLGMTPRECRGADGVANGALPAVTFIDVFPSSNANGTVDLSGTTLTVTHDAGPNIDVAFGDDAVLGTHGLAARLRAALPADILVSTNPVDWGIRFTATQAGRHASYVGTGGAAFGTQPASPARSFSINGNRTFTFTTTAPPSPDQATIIDQDAPPPPPPPPPPPVVPPIQTATFDMLAGVLDTADEAGVTSVELVHAFRRQVATAVPPVPVRVDLDLNPNHSATWNSSDEGVTTEVAFAPSDANVAWAGDTAARLFRSSDGGDSWVQVTPVPSIDHIGEIDAIAVHPDVPTTVLVGVYAEGAFSAPAGFLFKTEDSGSTWTHVGADIHDANDKRVGVRAIEFDRTDPDRIYAGTDLGVWSSRNGGSSWKPFNQGLPNARVADLTYEPRQRLLRAGVWGRGVYERHVGDEPVKNVRLHIRTTTLDDGWNQPVPGPAVDALVPGSVVLDESPDIKHTQSSPRRGLVLDGVEFDEDVVNESIRAGKAFVTVQVNNRGAFSTSTTRVALLWAPADDGPPALPDALWDALDAGPLTVGGTFGSWKVIGDAAPDDAADVGHKIIAPGYPRAVIFGEAPAHEWLAADVKGHRRIGLLAFARCDEDPLRRGPADVIDLIRRDSKAAYRECDVVDAASDDRIVLRATGPVGFTVAAPGAGFTDATDGAAPFGLAPVAVAAQVVEFPTAGPYNLTPPALPPPPPPPPPAPLARAFRLSVTHNVTIPFAAGDPAIRNLGAALADEVAAVINRSLIDAGVPVRSDGRSFRGNFQDTVSITPIGGAELTFTAASTAAAVLGMPTGVTRTAALGQSFFTPLASHGPFNLTPGAPLQLVCTVVVNALVQFPATTKEIPSLATATARQVRAAINRQCRENGIGVVAEPRRLGLSVRRSATESTGSRVVTGGFGLGDLVIAPGAEIAAGAARDALFDVVTTWGRDVLVPSATNRLYLRSANVGNVALATVRHRLYQVTLAPFGIAAVGTTADEPRPPGGSGVASLTWDVGALAAGSRVFVIAVADTAADPLDPTAADAIATGAITSLDAAHTFCIDHPNAALREFVVA